MKRFVKLLCIVLAFFLVSSCADTADYPLPVERALSAACYDSAWARWGAEIPATLTVVPDVQVLKADYLIRAIDDVFSMWRKPWNTRVGFNLFCCYVLPYRLGCEPLSDWRPLYRECKEAYLRPAAERANPTYLYGVCNALNRDFADNLYEPSFPLPEFPLDRLIDLKSGTCREFTLMAAAYDPDISCNPEGQMSKNVTSSSASAS
ncbi:MAG: hypothetical protein ACOYJE_08305 [Bacteroidaceae bacterium]|jgi:hypothetical protein